MKKSNFKFPVLIIILFFTFSQYTEAQVFSSRLLTRGADTAEIYLSCLWYVDNSITWNGIFHSTDNGQTLSIQRKTDWNKDSGWIFGDSLPGALFQIPFHSSADTFGISYDYGKTFEAKYFPNLSQSIAGCMAGEQYINAYDLYRSTGYGNSFVLQYPNFYLDSLLLKEVGTLPGELFCYKSPYEYDSLGLAFSNDYGQSFTVSFIKFPGVPDFCECNIHRGTLPGEIYFAVHKNSNEVVLFHSFDYGQTLEYKSDILLIYDEILYTAGRTPGSFYHVQMNVCGQYFDHACIWISFSRDYGVTYTTYYHELDSLYTGISESPRPTTDFNVFPNPANDLLSVELPVNLFGAEIELFDMVGKLLSTVRISPNHKKADIDISGFKPGIYFLRFRDGDRVTGMKKVVVAR